MYSNANSAEIGASHNPWNKGRLIGPKPPLKLREIGRSGSDCNWPSVLFNLSIDSKLRGCDLVKLQVRDVAHSGRVISRSNGRAAEDDADGEMDSDDSATYEMTWSVATLGQRAGFGRYAGR
ncbi:MAG: hypothetical protein ACREX9_18390 [Gammaproteobacteria bacterium]